MVLGAHSFMFLCVIYLSYNSVTIHSVFIFRAVAVAVMFTRKCFKFIHFSYRFAGHGFFYGVLLKHTRYALFVRSWFCMYSIDVKLNRNAFGMD